MANWIIIFFSQYLGAVEGPSEFAEGLVIGVRSVFSGVVGGAAGTVSRITGALGKNTKNPEISGGIWENPEHFPGSTELLVKNMP